jgi:hypothetical protein
MSQGTPDISADASPSPEQSAAYVSTGLKIHLVCLTGSNPAFVDDIFSYLATLGLTVSREELATQAALSEFMADLPGKSQEVQAVVIPIEGQQPGMDGAPPIPGVRLSPQSTALVEICAAEMSPKRCFAIAQRDDPVECDDLSVDVLRLCDRSAARTAFKERLLDAGCVIGGELVAEDQPDHKFEFPRDWWGITGGESEAPPSFTEFLVDSAFNRLLTQTKLQEEAMKRVRNAEELDLKYHYVGWKMAENWNRLTDDRTYAHGQHRQQLASLIQDMTAELPTDGAYRYVSLGPGDGKTDVALLPALSKALPITSCFFVDVSIELLQVSTDRVITDLVEKDVISPRHIRAVLGDFEDSLSKLAPVLTGFGDRSFFSLNGFTIGNSTERDLVVSLSEGMQAGDFLLLDSRLHGLGKVTEISDDQRESLLEPYMSPAMKKFAFGPVEDLCDFVVRLDESESDHPEIRIRYEPELGTNTTTDVSNAINVYIYAEGMYGNDRFREKVGLKPISSLTVRGGREKRKALRLVTLTFYDFDSLAEWLDGTGLFKVRWKRDLERIGLFLLERTDAHAP